MTFLKFNLISDMIVLDPLLFTTPMQIFSRTGSSLRISQKFQGLGPGLPSTLTSGSLAHNATGGHSALLDVVYSQANTSGNSERPNPKLPSQLASELISSDDHSGSSPILGCSIASTAIRWKVPRLSKLGQSQLSMHYLLLSSSANTTFSPAEVSCN